MCTSGDGAMKRTGSLTLGAPFPFVMSTRTDSWSGLDSAVEGVCMCWLVARQSRQGTCADGCHHYISQPRIALTSEHSCWVLNLSRQTDPGKGISLATWRWPEGSVVWYSLLGMHKTMSRPTTGAPLSRT